MIIYNNPKYIQVVYHPDKGYILFDWVDFLIPLQDIQELHAKALAVAEEKGCYHFVAETSKVTNALRPDVIEWWSDVWVSKLVAAGLRAVITVVPSTAFAAMSTHSWQSQVVDGILMQNVKSLADAEAVIMDLRQKQGE